jgi:peptidoglycan/LPS O-acetylase OafA/YrhL
MWTIQYEFICYLTVLGLGAIGLFKFKRLFIAILGAIELLFAAKNFGYLTNLQIPTDELSHPLIRFYSFFFTGSLFYFYRQRISYDKTLALFASAGLFFGMFYAATAELSILEFGSYLLFYFAFIECKRLSQFHQMPDASYGLYLYGGPIRKLLTWYLPGISPWTCGLLSWFLVEKPALKLKTH